jgi:hypothetical protein
LLKETIQAGLKLKAVKLHQLKGASTSIRRCRKRKYVSRPMPGCMIVRDSDY